jgi:hypothetical protein
VIGKAERGAVGGQIGRAIAQDHVLLAEAQMGEETLDVGDLLERAEHDDDVGLRRGLGRKLAGVEIADDRAAVALDAVAALVAAAIRKQPLQRHAAAAEIEHARAGGDELGGKFGTRVGRERGRVRTPFDLVGCLECEIEIDVQVHVRRAEVAMPDPAQAGESP